MARKSRKHRRSHGFPHAARGVPPQSAPKPNLLPPPSTASATPQYSRLPISASDPIPASSPNPNHANPSSANPHPSPLHPRHHDLWERAQTFMRLTGRNPIPDDLHLLNHERSLELHHPDPCDQPDLPDHASPPAPRPDRARKYLALKRDIRAIVRDFSREFPNPNLFEAIQLKKLRAACLMMTEIERSTPGFPIVHPEASDDPQIRRSYIAHRRDFDRAAAALLRRAERRESFALRAQNPRFQKSLYQPDPPRTSTNPSTPPAPVPAPAPPPNPTPDSTLPQLQPEPPSIPPEPSRDTHQHPANQPLVTSWMAPRPALAMADPDHPAITPVDPATPPLTPPG